MYSVEQVMTRSVITVTRETPISEVARLLVEHAISGLPVVDSEGRVIGVVSEGDLLVREAGRRAPARRPLARLRAPDRGARARRSKVEAATAGEMMTSPALTFEPYRALRTAAQVMTANEVNRLPVVDADGRLLGIVTRADLVRAFVRTDDELVEEIRREVLIRTMWLDPDRFAVTVSRGAARISGAVQKRSTAELVERFVMLMPGIISVETDITWTDDDGGLTVP
jgi:CBS domain-containing protein